MLKSKDGIGIETEEEFRQFFNNPDYIHIVGLIAPLRPGVNLFMVKLEHTYFPPGTVANNWFFLRLQKWEEMIWAIVSIPKDKKYLAEETATECGLRIADGIPHVVAGERISQFPISNGRVFTLENTKGHPIYRNDSKEIAELLIKENEQITEIIKKHAQRQQNAINIPIE